MRSFKTFQFGMTLFLAAACPAVMAQEGGRVVATPNPASAIPMPTSNLPTVNRLIADILRAENAKNANDLVLAYGNSVRDPQLARGTLSALLYDYYRLRAIAGSTMQVSQAVDETALRFAIFQSAQGQVQVQQNQQILDQNQRLIDQNATIIKQNDRTNALLEQIARKR
jgi:hypothetical protein